MIFWIVTGAMALIVSAALIAALLRGRAAEAPPAAYDLVVYRDQLKDVERDLARGTLSEAEAERTRTEIGRRILAADAQLHAGGADGGQPRAIGRAMAVLVVLALVGGSLAIYGTIGAPGYDDLPRSARLAASEQARTNRLSQAEAEARAGQPGALPDPGAEFAALMEKLRAAVKKNPDDTRGLRLLARNEASLGNTRAAIEAQTRLIELLGDSVRAQDHAFLADLMITAAGGYVSREAERTLRAALALDPGQGEARYYLGLYFAQVDRPDAAFRLWDALLRESPRDAAWVPPIRANIEALAGRAGISYTLPPAGTPDTSGPSAADMDAAAGMTPEARAEMIQGMVAQLSDRLATEGGPPEDWARLIAAYGVLDQTERAALIWSEAQEVFADDPDALDLVRKGAQRAGVAP